MAGLIYCADYLLDGVNVGEVVGGVVGNSVGIAKKRNKARIVRI